MTTKTEAAAQEKIGRKVCLNCVYSFPGFKREEPVLKCGLTGKVVPPGMLWCFYGKYARG